MKPLVSVVILNYNGERFLKACLLSLLKSSYENVEIIFVDNNSKDESVEIVKKIKKSKMKDKYNAKVRIKIIENEKNYGYAEGNNIGARKARGRYIFFLNNDTIVERNCIKNLVNFLERNKDVAALSCKLIKMKSRMKSRKIDSLGHYINKIGITFMIGKDKDSNCFNKIKKVFSFSGAAFMIRKTLFEKLGGFDKDFFLYFEETDLSWRLWLCGYKIFSIPNAIVFHETDATASKLKLIKKTYLFLRNRINSFIKNYELKNLVIYLPLQIITMLSYGFFKVITKRQLNIILALPLAVFWNLISMKSTLKKRKKIQKLRRVNDIYLFQQNLIKKIKLKDFLFKGKELNLFS